MTIPFFLPRHLFRVVTCYMAISTIVVLRRRHASTARITLCLVHTEDAMLQLAVDPAAAPTLGYVVGSHVVLD